MNMREVIYARHSVRQYTETTVDRATIEQLLHTAVQAPSAMNTQPWAFGVIQGAEVLRRFSDRAKSYLLSLLDQRPWVRGYQPMLENPDFNMFYNAPALVVIYARPVGPEPEQNCCLAAENLMLAACELGLGTCWIGFATAYFNRPDIKDDLGVPAECTAVAQIIVGYPAGDIPPVEKNPPQILFWQ